MVLAAQLDDLSGASDRYFHLINQAGTFMDVVEGARFYRLHGSFIIFNCGDQYDRCLGRDLARMSQYFDAVRVWHLDVGDQHVVTSALQLSLCRLAAIHRLDAM